MRGRERERIPGEAGRLQNSRLVSLRGLRSRPPPAPAPAPALYQSKLFPVFSSNIPSGGDAYRTHGSRAVPASRWLRLRLCVLLYQNKLFPVFSSNIPSGGDACRSHGALKSRPSFKVASAPAPALVIS